MMSRDAGQPSPEESRKFSGTERFVVRKFVGSGSRGLVYRVLDLETGAEVALKTISALAPDRVLEIKQEFRVLAGIRHRNLVDLYELFVDDSHCFFTMEFIAGRPFLEAASGQAPVLGESRLRWFGEMTLQLVAGLETLHAAGKVHRDIKPTNVLISEDERVVLLDFGLSAAIPSADGSSTMGIGGSPAYMAPEQWWGHPPDPRSDWYSFGAMLYEGLSGRLPFDAASPLDLLRAKESKSPTPLDDLQPDIPAELSQLLLDLLSPRPEQRPGANAIKQTLRMLVAPALDRPRADSPRLQSVGSRFVGREPELSVLEGLSLEVGKETGPVVVHVEGRSGIGKSELSREFAMRAASRACVLRARCHPQEAVPFKALDPVIDELSLRLAAMPTADLEKLAPEHAGALIRLFPVFGCIRGMVREDAPPVPPEAYEVRRRAFEALRELLANVVLRFPVIVWIDDFHWGDLDSVVALHEIVKGPGAPSIMVVLAYRSEERERVASLLSEPGDALVESAVAVHLGPLGPTESLELAGRYFADLGSAFVDDRVVAAVATEANGSPFFIGELVRVAAHRSDGDHDDTISRLRLTDVFEERLRELDERAQRALEVVAVAGWPLHRSAALAAAELPESDRPVLWRLEQECLLRGTSIGGEAALEVYHDRIRESVLERIPGERRREHHLAIASTLERQSAPDPQALFEHYLGGGDRERATPYAVAAADRAAASLAFARARILYEQAIDLGLDPAEEADVVRRLAEVLQAAGRGMEAAATFDRAARAMRALGMPRDRVLNLQRKASEQFVRSGDIERGTALLRSFLAEVGIAIPGSPRRALARSLLLRLRLMWRGTDLSPRPRRRSSAHDGQRLEALWSAAASLTMVDPMLADAMTVQGLLTAHDMGNASHTIRGLGLEAAREAALGGPIFGPRSTRLVETLQRIARQSTDPYDVGWVHQSVGATSYLRGEWKTARDECGRAVGIWRDGCVGAEWEIATAESFELSALTYMGDLPTLARRLPAALADGENRDDVYAASGYRMGIMNLHWLALDRPDQALDGADGAIARWPSGTFLLQHFLHLVGVMHVDLYVGDAWRAWRRICEAWPALRRAQLLAIGSARVELLHLRARAAIAAASVPSPDVGSGWSRSKLLAVAARDARALRREKLRPAPLFAALIEAALAAQDGRRETACARLAEAVSAADAADMDLYRAAALMCGVPSSASASSSGAYEDARGWLSARGVARPEAFVRMLAPGVGLERRARASLP